MDNNTKMDPETEVELAQESIYAEVDSMANREIVFSLSCTCPTTRKYVAHLSDDGKIDYHTFAKLLALISHLENKWSEITNSKVDQYIEEKYE